MDDYIIHKGVGKTVELFGLRSQYLIGFCVGIMCIFILFVILRMVNIPIIASVLITIVGLVGLLRYVFLFNQKYGQYGLMKKNALKRYPRFIISRKSFYTMLMKRKSNY
jgi:hypothetical protein